MVVKRLTRLLKKSCLYTINSQLTKIKKEQNSNKNQFEIIKTLL